jgi:hypothetical protein
MGMFRAAHPCAHPLAQQMLTSAPTPSAPPTPTFVRPVLALLAGLGITVVLVALATVAAALAMLRGGDAKSLLASTDYLAVGLAIGLVGAVAGGFTTARITHGRSPYTISLLALMLFVSAIVPVLRGAPVQAGPPAWQSIALAVIEPLGVLLGAYLERRQRLRMTAVP